MTSRSVSDLTTDRRAIPAGAIEGRWTARDGWEIRRFDWPATQEIRPRGSLLFLPGRGDFYEKWLEAIGHWHARGWSVTALDWRGQALSGRLGNDDATGHVPDYDIWIEDLAAFWSDWTRATGEPHVLVAHSMGGHIALRALGEGSIVPDAVVLSAPMLGFLPDWLPREVLHLFARLMVALRGAFSPAWRGEERPEVASIDRFALLTHDRDRYADEAWWRRERPGLALGSPSWGWIERSLASMAMFRRPGFIEAIEAPALILATRKDRLVSWRAIRQVAARFPRAHLIAYGEEARHEILREVDDLRMAALAEIDTFLDSNALAR